MSATTEISWCDSTHNFWRGCEKIKDFDAPLRWNEKPWVCDRCGSAVAGLSFAEKIVGPCGTCNASRMFHRRRVFSLSLGDWLDPEVPIEWLAEMLDVIRRCPNLDFLLLTKRPELWRARMETVWGCYDNGHPAFDWAMAWYKGEAPANVWIGFTAEDQERFNQRAVAAWNIPSFVYFVSYEPALGPLDISIEYLRLKCGGEYPFKHLTRDKRTPATQFLDWVIVGGESGKGARPFNVEWARSIVRQCREASVPVFVKQLGARPYSIADKIGHKGWDSKSAYVEAGKPVPPVAFYRYLNDKKGGDISEWPADLRVREWPKVEGAR